MHVPPRSRLRVRTLPLPNGHLPRGRDVIVEIVHTDGTTERVPDVTGLRIEILVDGQRDYVVAHIDALVDVDIEAVSG